MMDLSEIIKWFIPCFHILRVIIKIKDLRLMFICLFLLFNFRTGLAAKLDSDTANAGLDENKLSNLNETKNLDNYIYEDSLNFNQSDVLSDVLAKNVFGDVSTGRTFGRPFKKMAAALIPLIFHIGAASTWAVVAALIGFKTLAVTLLILKLLLVAGAAKIGALFGQKHPHHSWEPPQHYETHWEPPHPQKEIHLHIHNGQHQEEHAPYAGWSRDGTASPVDSKNIIITDPFTAGPQTISTPYGNYVRVHPGTPETAPGKRK